MQTSLDGCIRFSAVSIGWLCFRLEFVSDFFIYAKTLLGVGSGDLTYTWRFYMTPKLLFLLVIACGGILLLSRERLQRLLRRWDGTSLTFSVIKYVGLFALLVASLVGIVVNGYAPFLYFQF